MKRKVVVTSSSGIDYLGRTEDIGVIRTLICTDDKQYKDGLDIDYMTLSSLMIGNPKQIIRTNPPTLENLIHFFNRLYAEGYEEVFVVCVSSWMSDTYYLLQQAKAKISNTMFIHLFDSRSVGYSEFYLARYAHQLLKKNINTLEIANHLEIIRKNLHFWFVMDDFQAMVNTNKLSKPAAVFANLFNLKPILEVNTLGEIMPIFKVRNIDNALLKMCQTAKAQHKENHIKTYYIADFGSQELVAKLILCMQKTGLPEPEVFPASPTSIVNHGPLGVGLGCIFEDTIHN